MSGREKLRRADMKTPPEDRVVPMRVQKFLARAGVASRRGSENLMTAGRVRVNGVVVTELGSKVDPAVDEVTVDGVPVHLADAAHTIMLNKPAGVITTMREQTGRPCVAELVPTDRFPGLYPIGRLDSDTTGLLLFSTDGELGNGLLHPSHHVAKTYLALVDGKVGARELRQLHAGVMLDDGPTQPADVEVVDLDEADRIPGGLVLPWQLMEGSRRRAELKRERGRARTLLRLVIHEGRYHQVKRMCKAVGHTVVALHREAFGPIGLGGLERGAWRELSPDEVRALRDAVGPRTERPV
jgi:23S rRNA pseudouridine2605 synthase